LENGKYDLKYSTTSNNISEIENLSLKEKSSKITCANKNKSVSKNMFSQFRTENDNFPEFDFEFSDANISVGNDIFYLELMEDANSKEKDLFLDLEQEEEEDELISNSRLDSYLDEVVELVLKDFIMSWLNNFIWEKESVKIVSQARL
jgi:hypothetical protein